MNIFNNFTGENLKKFCIKIQPKRLHNVKENRHEKKEISYIFACENLLTLFHVASEPTYFTLEGELSSPPSNFVIFKDRDLKFGDDVYF